MDVNEKKGRYSDRQNGVAGWLSGYIALDWRSKGRGFESRQEHKKRVFPSQKGCADSLSVGVPNPPCVLYARIRKTMYAR